MRAAIRRWWARSWFHLTHCGEVGTGTGYTLNGRFHEARYNRCVCAEAGFNWTDFSFEHTAEDFTSQDQHSGDANG